MSLIHNEETIPKDLPDFQQNGNTKVKKDEKAFIKKAKWSNDAEFLLSCISLSVVSNIKFLTLNNL